MEMGCYTSEKNHSVTKETNPHSNKKKINGKARQGYQEASVTELWLCATRSLPLEGKMRVTHQGLCSLQQLVVLCLESSDLQRL